MAGILHGGNIAEAAKRYGGEVGDWLDLSTGINPNYWPVGTIRQSAWHRLPGGKEEQRLLRVARDYYGVHKHAKIFCANGTQAIIQLLPQIFDKKCKVEIVQPTYGEHGYCWQQAGHDVSSVPGIEAFGDPDIAIVVNPNNPDGRMSERGALVKLAEKLSKTGGVLIVDEAFGDCFAHLSLAGCNLNNVVVLKSFGKFFGLAGLRLGFAIGSAGMVEKLDIQTGPWMVSGPALEIGAKALSDVQWVNNTRTWILRQSERQLKLLCEAGLECAGNGGLFIPTRHAQSDMIYKGLAARHILVRQFPDRETCLRFGLCGNDEQIDRLALGLKEVMHG